MGGESLNAEGFGRVVAGIEEVHAEFFRQGVGVMRAFPAEEGVASQICSLRDFGAGTSAADADLANALRSTRSDVDTSAECMLEIPHQSCARGVKRSGESDGLAFGDESRLAFLNAEEFGELRVVSERCVEIEREMGACLLYTSPSPRD